MKILYFADIRYSVGLDEEDLVLPSGVLTLGDLVNFLRLRGDNYVRAFSGDVIVRASVNCEFCDFSVVISDSDEVAFFPPVTGG